MTSFATDFPSATLGQLGLSYRSTQKILNTFGKFSAGMPLSAELANLPLTAVRETGTAMPEIRTLDDPEDEAAGIAASVRELEKAGIALRDQAVLCRTNDRVAEIAQALEERGIPVLHLGSLFEREEIRDLLSILSLATDRFGAGLVRIAALPCYKVPARDVKLLIDHLQDRTDYTIARLGELSALTALSSTGAQAVARLADDLKGLKPSAAAWDLLCTYLLDRTDTVRRMVAASGIGDRMRAIAVWQFLNFLRDQSPVTTGSPVQTLLDRVRNLVLLAEERDLRQVPDAALQMNAVRLMTIHGSKGLEFDAVHIPGLVKTGIPASFRGLSCPVPEGMIEGAVGNVREEAERAHKQEQECLFFVAMSRAKTHLHLYSHRRQANGGTRNPSDYIQRLGSTLRTINAPDAILLPPKPVKSIDLTIADDWECTHLHVSAYERCPRRYFYTHVFGIGTARRTTPFERTHSCIYSFIDWLAQQRVSGSPTIEAAHAAFEEIWKVNGPTESAYAADYRKLAGSLVELLIRAGAGRRFREAEPLAINYRNGKIMVLPDEIAERDDGVIVVRRVRTGRRSKSEFGKIEYSLLHRATVERFGAGAVVEAVHPSDTGVESVPPPKNAAKSDARVEEILADISSGNFPPDQDSFTCPRCPHFFICAAAPDGPLLIE